MLEEVYCRKGAWPLHGVADAGGSGWTYDRGKRRRANLRVADSPRSRRRLARQVRHRVREGFGTLVNGFGYRLRASEGIL